MRPQDLSTLGPLYADWHGLALATVSTKVAGAGHVLDRIRNAEATLTFRKYDSVVHWFSVNWPSDLERPTDIPCPDPGETSRGMTGGNGDRGGDSRANHSRKSDDVRTAIQSREECRARRMGTGAGT